MRKTAGQRAYDAVGGAAAHLATAVSPVWPSLRDRLGRDGWEEAGVRPLWCHGASVGEMGSLAPVVIEIRRHRPDIVWGVTTTTATGRDRARRTLPEARFHELLPLDGHPSVTRALDRIDPGAILLVETEIWPTLLRLGRERAIPTALVSARLTDRSIRGYRRWAGLFRPALAGLDLIAARSDRDRAHFIDLGADPGRVVTLGNSKLDGAPDPVDDAVTAELAAFDTDRPCVVWGCLRPRDVPLISTCMREFGGDVRWVIAPRHPDTFDDLGARVGGVAAELDLRFARWSDHAPAPTDVVFLDALGVLGAAYRAADIAVVGGTFHDYGGHNLMEPAQFGVAVLHGPDTSSWPDDADALESAGGSRRVTDADALTRALRGWLADDAARRNAGERARAAASAGRGASRRIVAALDDIDFFAAVSGAAAR